jgi:hypothetical protein
MRKPIKLLIFVSIAIVLISFVLFYWFRMRDPHAPAVVVVSACRDVLPNARRIKADFGTQFDVSEKAFSVKDGLQDMPPGKFYVITAKNSAAEVIIAHDDGVWEDLKKGPRTFSRRVKDPNQGTNGKSVGTDLWGYLESGERWRYVAFPSGDAVGYRPVPLNEAIEFDQVIHSACR